MKFCQFCKGLVHLHPDLASCFACRSDRTGFEPAIEHAGKTYHQTCFDKVREVARRTGGAL